MRAFIKPNSGMRGPALLLHAGSRKIRYDLGKRRLDDFFRKNHVDIDTLHDMLSRSYWAKNRSREDVEKSVANSLCFSLIRDEEQIGFARVLTDTMAYAFDVSVKIKSLKVTNLNAKTS